MTAQDGLFGTPKPRAGRHTAGYARALRALLADGHLAGDRHAATRAILRELAENVDRTALERRNGDVTGYSLAMVIRVYEETLARYLAADDPVDRELAGIIAAATTDP